MVATRRLLLLSVFLLLLPALAFAQEASLSRTHYEAEPGLSVMLLQLKAGNQAVHGFYVEDPTGSVQELVSPNGWSGVTSGELTLFHSLDKPVASGRTLTFKVLTKNPNATLNWYVQDSKGRIGATRQL